MKPIAITALASVLSTGIVSASWAGNLFQQNLAARGLALKPRASPSPPTTDYKLGFPPGADYTRCPATFTSEGQNVYWFADGTAETWCTYLDDQQNFFTCQYNAFDGTLVNTNEECPPVTFPVGEQDKICATQCHDTTYPIDYGVVDRINGYSICFFTIPRDNLQVGCFYNSTDGGEFTDVNAGTPECATASVTLGNCIDGPFST